MNKLIVLVSLVLSTFSAACNGDVDNDEVSSETGGGSSSTSSSSGDSSDAGTDVAHTDAADADAATEPTTTCTPGFVPDCLDVAGAPLPDGTSCFAPPTGAAGTCTEGKCCTVSQ